jgi:plasmid stability protein
MRTTLTLDDDVARQLRRRAKGKHGGFKQVVNETLRRGLATGEKPAAEQPPFEVQAKHCGFRPGVDIFKLNQLLDEEEAGRFVVSHTDTKTEES